MNRSLRALLAVTAVATATLSLAACATGGATSVVGSWGQVDVQGEPSLVFAEDGSFSGSDGCNRLFGEYTVNDGVVEIAPVGSTMMFCEGVDTWLLNAATAIVDGDTLVISDAAEVEIGLLERAS